MDQLHFFSDFLAERYGKKLFRIPFDLALGCPNRVNRFGAGCAFCAEDGSRARHLSRTLDLAGQARAGIAFAQERYGAQDAFIAYFQAFTSTYAPAAELERLYREALAAADFKVVIIGTRPDALPPETVALLAKLAREYEVWVELGVQSCNDEVLQLIRRGHDFAATVSAVHRLAGAGIAVGAHLIAGLPGETEEAFVAGAATLAALPFRAVKLHQLLTLRGTPLASPEFPVKPEGLNEYDYARWAARFLRQLPEEWLVMRLIAEAEPATIITPKWWMNKGQFLDFFRDYYARRGETEPFQGVRTADGTPTLYHPEFHQHFHSLAGAASEADHKFVEPSRLEERLRTGERVRLLDIGFGLGGNAAAAIRAARRAAAGTLEVLSLEIDRRVLGAARRLYAPDSLEFALISGLETDGVYREERVEVRLAVGDARDLLRECNGAFDVIFQDGFSPDCNPELWSYDLIRCLARRLKPGGVTVSYCSSYPFRGALFRAGLQVGESQPFGRRRGGTVAAFDPALLPLPLSEKERGIVLSSTAGVPYRDVTLRGSRPELFRRREALVRRLRARGVPKWWTPGRQA